MERRYLMVKTAVVRVLPVQYPFLFRNVVFADFSGMFENSLKKTLVDRDEKNGEKLNAISLKICAMRAETLSASSFSS
ncbi:MAG: hypothetical protein SPL21_01290 [Fibrobacter sp.]|nr:hypothetical protein [Fibrobacter sp.]